MGDIDESGTVDLYELDAVSWMVCELLAEFHDLATNPIDSFFNANESYFLEEIGQRAGNELVSVAELHKGEDS
jgi:hypothetical protein